MSAKKRYAQVGLGARSWMYSLAIAGKYADRATLVGLCDRNAGRLLQRADWARSSGFDIEACDSAGFEELLEVQQPDCVIVATDDRDHDHYICLAMEHGCDVVTEKPLTIDAARCQRVLDTQTRTGRDCRVTFNYRYSPARSQIKELLAAGVIGDVLSLDFHWYLDTTHGADYFRRWHRRKESSGGLLVHKATHHFDLVNWWLDSLPARVSASGGRSFYTPSQADALGLAGRAPRCLDCPEQESCDFHLDLREVAPLKAIYLDHEGHDGYERDRCVFSDEIDIEDSVAACVDYANGARMSYSLNAFSPREGYTIAFNGTLGRLEHACEESSYISGVDGSPGELHPEATTTRLLLHRAPPRNVAVATSEGGHGGGDQRLLRDLFAPDPSADPLGRAADHRAGAWAILTGIAGNLSIERGEPIHVPSLVRGLS